VTPKQFWRLHPQEFWWLLEANKPDPIYRGKKHQITGSEVEGILADLKAKGIASKWHRRR
jgi:hypothetical protein